MSEDLHQARAFERLVFFSDAVFAIAITLLVLDLRAPVAADGTLRLARAIPNVIGFAISFFVIGLQWLSHHRLFATLGREDARLRGVNLLYLASVAFLPFPTSVVAQAPLSQTGAVFYAVSVAAMCGLQLVLVLAARRRGLMLPGETNGGTARLLLRSSAAPVVFLLSVVAVLGFGAVVAYPFWILAPFAARLADAAGARLARHIDSRASV